LKSIKQVFRAYDTYIKEEGSSKQKISRKKDDDDVT